MRICLVKNLNNTFKVAFDSDYENIKKLKAGEQYFFEVKKERNIKHHRKFFALIDMVYNNQDIYSNRDDLRNDLTIESGYFIKRINLQGEEIKQAKSISFAKMDQFEFNEFYSAVIDTVVKYFNFDKELIVENIEQYY